MKILKIAGSNIRRRKSNAVTFFIMSFLSAFMLYLASTLFVGIRTFYDEKHEQLSGSHYTVLMLDEESNEYFEDTVKHAGYTEKWKTAEGFVTEGDMPDADKTGSSMIFLNADDFRNSEILPLNFIEPLTSLPEQAIVVPYGMKASGIRIGDKISIKTDGKEFDFTVYAFFEDIEMGASTITLEKMYVFTDSLEMMEHSESFQKTYYGTVVLKDKSQLTAVQKELDLENTIGSLTYEGSKNASGTFITIMSVILLAFALLILMVALIVVRFDIKTSMEEDIITLGALKSIGFTSIQLMFSQIIQYVLIAFMGCICGMLAYGISFPYVGNVVAGTTGLLWLSGTDWEAVILSAITIMLLCFGIVLLLSVKIKKVTPVNALRQGESHHSFKKNRMPFSKFNLPLNLHLAFKNMAGSVKINITLGIVVAILSLQAAVVCVIYHNIVNPKAFYEMVGMEDVDNMVYVYEPILDEVQKDLENRDEIKSMISYKNMQSSVNDVVANTYIYEDFSVSTAKDLYMGRKPDADNEIALGVGIRGLTGKTIGDTVSVNAYGVTKDYIVVGLTQGLGDSGMSVSITLSGMERHHQGTILNSLGIVLKDGADEEALRQYITDTYGTQVVFVSVASMMENVFGPMESGIRTAVYADIIASACIIAFVLYLIINTLIRKEKKNYGILKACGFTNGQIVAQILMAYMPAAAGGSILGAIISIIFANDLLSVMFQSAGLNKTFFAVPVMQNIGICMGIFVVTAVVTLLTSLKIRKVSPHKLIVAE